MTFLPLAVQGNGRPAALALLGLGFGVAQNASLTLMFERVSASGYDMVNAGWLAPAVEAEARRRLVRR